MHVFITKTRENLFVVAEVLFFFASNGFKMPSSSFKTSGSSSDSLSLGSSSSLSSVSSVNETADGSGEEIMEMDDSKVTTHGSGEEIVEMDDSKVDEFEVKLDPYLKLEGNSGENKNEYTGLEQVIVAPCCSQLYMKFPLMESAFGEFAV